MYIRRDQTKPLPTTPASLISQFYAQPSPIYILVVSTCKQKRPICIYM